MIVHVVLARAREDLTSAEEQELAETLAGLKRVPGVRDFSSGPDISGRGKGYTHAAVMRMESRDGLQAYLSDELHLRIVETLNRLAPDRLIIDYETDGG